MSNETEQELVVKSALEKSSENLSKVTTSVAKAINGVVETVELELADLTEKVVEKSVALRDLEANFNTKQAEIKTAVKAAEDQAKVDTAESKRRADVKLELDIQENKDKTVADILAARGDIAINADELGSLRLEAAVANESNAQEVNKAVSTAVTKAASEKKQALEMATLENKAATAKKDADLTASNSKIEILESQLVEANSQIAELRKAMTEMITKQSAPVFNMAASK